MLVLGCKDMAQMTGAHYKTGLWLKSTSFCQDCSNALRDRLFSFHSVSKDMDSAKASSKDTVMNMMCKVAYSEKWIRANSVT